MMGKPVFSLLVCLICLLGLGACTSSISHRIPTPDSYELRGDRYHVTMKNGWTYSTREIRVANDSAYFNSRAVRLKEISKIETRSISVWKTLGLVTGTTVVAAGAFFTLVILMAFSARTHSV